MQVLAIVGAASTLLAIIFVFPLLAAILGAFSGWLLGLTPMGGWVVSGLGLVGLHLDAGQLWLLGAALAFVSGFFRAGVSANN